MQHAIRLASYFAGIDREGRLARDDVDVQASQRRFGDPGERYQVGQQAECRERWRTTYYRCRIVQVVEARYADDGYIVEYEDGSTFYVRQAQLRRAGAGGRAPGLQRIRSFLLQRRRWIRSRPTSPGVLYLLVPRRLDLEPHGPSPHAPRPPQREMDALSAMAEAQRDARQKHAAEAAAAGPRSASRTRRRTPRRRPSAASSPGLRPKRRRRRRRRGRGRGGAADGAVASAGQRAMGGHYDRGLFVVLTWRGARWASCGSRSRHPAEQGSAELPPRRHPTRRGSRKWSHCDDDDDDDDDDDNATAAGLRMLVEVRRGRACCTWASWEMRWRGRRRARLATFARLGRRPPHPASSSEGAIRSGRRGSGGIGEVLVLPLCGLRRLRGLAAAEALAAADVAERPELNGGGGGGAR